MEKVLVEWLDSNTVHGWDMSDGSDRSVAHCSSVGFLLREDDEQVTIAQSISTLGSVMNTLTIPRPAVVRMKILRQR